MLADAKQSNLTEFASKHGVQVEFLEVETNMEQFRELGLRATPSIFIGNELIDLGKFSSYEELNHYIVENVK
ncbi:MULTISPECIES: DsbA family protein [unclassified Agarivorans]|uniref:DsbA family protein n=1 Tax=unclassified Agarivorans TaxID=2636026 RepID=UPI003D7E3A92